MYRIFGMNMGKVTNADLHNMQDGLITLTEQSFLLELKKSAEKLQTQLVNYDEELKDSKKTNLEYEIALRSVDTFINSCNDMLGKNKDIRWTLKVVKNFTNIIKSAEEKKKVTVEEDVIELRESLKKSEAAIEAILTEVREVRAKISLLGRMNIEQQKEAIGGAMEILKSDGKIFDNITIVRNVFADVDKKVNSWGWKQDREI